MEITETELLNMKLHSTKKIDNSRGHIKILRVIGGWIYTIIYCGHMSTKFVPEKTY